jgi:hypothetical protein
MATRSDLHAPGQQEDALSTVSEALGRLRYGVIQLTVHDGKLMQIDVTERRRFAG